jgi:hypothetical protein
MQSRNLTLSTERGAIRGVVNANRKGMIMDRLSIVLTLIVGSVVTGTLITAVLSLGWYSWPAIGGAAAIGFVITWPVSYVISRLIKRDDPRWDETKVDRVDGIVPEKSAPEV